MMMMRYFYLRRYASVFQKMTGLRIREFDELVEEVRFRFKESEEGRLDRPERVERLVAGGRRR